MSYGATKRDLRKMYSDLSEITERESVYLYRLAWRAKHHHCAEKTVEEIRSEARELHMCAHPERVIEPCRHWHYAFRH